MKPMSRILPWGDGQNLKVHEMRDKVCQNVSIHWLKIAKLKGTNAFRNLKHDRTLHVGLFKNPKNQP